MHRMRRLAPAAVVLAMILGCGGEAVEVRMGTEGAYPPYNHMDDSGELIGFEIDLGNDLCQRAELKCTWVQ